MKHFSSELDLRGRSVHITHAYGGETGGIVTIPEDCMREDLGWCVRYATGNPSYISQPVQPAAGRFYADWVIDEVCPRVGPAIVPPPKTPFKVFYDSHRQHVKWLNDKAKEARRMADDRRPSSDVQKAIDEFVNRSREAHARIRAAADFELITPSQASVFADDLSLPCKLVQQMARDEDLRW